MTIEQFITETNSVKQTDRFTTTLRPRIICNDGFSMSVQASQYAYCMPRVTNGIFYTEMEIGFPDKVEELIMKYAEDGNNPTETVYGYVPTEVINAVIEKHKGINVELTLKK